MAEEETGQERTEEATPRRIERAREEGQIPRSRELNTAAVLLAGTFAMLVFGPGIAARMLALARDSFQIDRGEAFDTGFMASHLAGSVGWTLEGLAPSLALLLAVALLAPAALGGWMFSAKPLMPKWERLDPLAGIARMFSLRSLVELLKAIAKVLVVGGSAVWLLWWLEADFMGLASEAMEPAVAHSVSIVLWSALALSASTLLIAAVDVPFQLFDHAKKLRMTNQQVRDEMKETEGRPEVKGRIRQMQRQIARARMMSAVPKADVVITNPTHYAVALRYDLSKAGAPVLVAKGADLIAFRIREIAQASGVPVVSSPRLARAIFHTTELEREIPAALYLAVAQVLAYVFHLRTRRRGAGPAPTLPADFDIPEGMDQPRGRR
jgi:flagellar biosynthetic protein FlhB